MSSGSVSIFSTVPLHHRLRDRNRHSCRRRRLNNRSSDLHSDYCTLMLLSDIGILCVSRRESRTVGKRGKIDSSLLRIVIEHEGLQCSLLFPLLKLNHQVLL